MSSQTPPLAAKHTGMRVSASGLLERLANGAELTSWERYMLGELYRHLEHLAEQYYAGNVAIMDEFLQLYCLDADREAARQRAGEGEA